MCAPPTHPGEAGAAADGILRAAPERPGMTDDATLDRFLPDDGGGAGERPDGDGGGSETDDGGERPDGEERECPDGDAGGPETDDGGQRVEPTTATLAWTPDGAACAACGTRVERRWHDDGVLVCGDCKDWR